MGPTVVPWALWAGPSRPSDSRVRLARELLVVCWARILNTVSCCGGCLYVLRTHHMMRHLPRRARSPCVWWSRDDWEADPISGASLQAGPISLSHTHSLSPCARLVSVYPCLVLLVLLGATAARYTCCTTRTTAPAGRGLHGLLGRTQGE